MPFILLLMVNSTHLHSTWRTQAMATIVIKDLTDSINLDHEAMVAITGGSRSRNRPTFAGRMAPRSSRLFTYPGGFTSNPLTSADKRAGGTKTLK
jgi:hypothetical protein